MPEIEKNFKKLMLKIGFAMLIFVGVFEILAVVWVIADALLAAASVENPVAAAILSQTIYGLIYAMSFALPAVLLALMTKDDKQPLIKGASLPKETVLYVFAGVAMILAFAYVNSILVSPFQINDLIGENWKDGYDQPYEIVLQLITTAVIPGVFEELMFRGVMLAKLRPYGKTLAILISALMFSLMHQNSGQFLYAFAAGILLGWIATETESLLLCMIVHFSNNAFSVLEQTARANMQEDAFGIAFYLIELLIFVLGVACFVLLIRSYEKKKREQGNDFSAGMFKKELVLKSENADFAISPAGAVKLFFAPTVIIFICIAMAQVILSALLSMLGLSLI